MISGIIEEGLHPHVFLETSGRHDTANLLMLVDTGFDLDIGLHYDFADRLGLEIYDFAKIEYANGKSENELVCHAQVKWHGQWQYIDVVLSDDEESAIGTRLLQGCIMNMDFIQNILTID